jgi:hypothetical protein
LIAASATAHHASEARQSLLTGAFLAEWPLQPDWYTMTPGRTRTKGSRGRLRIVVVASAVTSLLLIALLSNDSVAFKGFSASQKASVAVEKPVEPLEVRGTVSFYTNQPPGQFSIAVAAFCPISWGVINIPPTNLRLVLARF